MQGSMNMSCSKVVMLLTIHVCITVEHDESISGIFLSCPRVEQAGRSLACHFPFLKQNFSVIYAEKGHRGHQL